MAEGEGEGGGGGAEGRRARRGTASCFIGRRSLRTRMQGCSWLWACRLVVMLPLRVSLGTRHLRGVMSCTIAYDSHPIDSWQT